MIAGLPMPTHEHSERDFVGALFAEYFVPRAVLPVDLWADENRVLPKGSAEPGPWRTQRTPFARQVMRDLSDDSPYEDVVLMCATQLMKSECGLNWLGSIMEQGLGPTLVMQATIGTGERYSKQRIAPMIQSCPTLSAKIPGARSRDSGNTVLLKEYPGGPLYIAGAESAAGLASISVKYVHFDERDDYPDEVDGQGEPTKIARARQDTFFRRKRLTSSSPKRPKGESRIEAEFQAGTRFFYAVPCPHCDQKQRLTWDHVERMESGAAVYRCCSCAALIEEHHKPEMLAGGEWIAEAPDARVRSYHLNSLYSPLGWLSWSTLCDEHMEAEQALERGDDKPMKAFHNTRLALTFEEKTEKIEADTLSERAEDYPLRRVPMGGLVLTAGIDVQDDRVEVKVDAWGEGDESWVVDYVRLDGDPARPELWSKLSAYLESDFAHESGASLRISAEAIDTGGHFTHEVYNFARSRKRTFAIKGAVRPGLPVKSKSSLVDVNFRGAVLKRGARLWFIGTDTAKDLIHNRLGLKQAGPGYVHLSSELDDAFFAGLTAEHRIKRKTSRGFVFGWIKKTANARNEPLDCSVYSLFAAHALNLPQFTARMWQLRRTKLEKRALDQKAAPTVKPPVITPPQPSPAAARAPQRQRRHGGFVMGWK